jgi:hypothetical protein
MWRMVTVYILVLLVIGASSSNRVGAQRKSAKLTPSLFEPENKNRGFEDASPPSDLVLDALLNTQEAIDVHEEFSNRDRVGLRGLFEVARTNLGAMEGIDYVVLGKGPMTGADCFWFWIVSVRKGKADVLLFSNGLSLSLQKLKTDGYKNIKVDWATAGYVGSRYYRYDGSKYRLFKEHTKENK